MKISPEKLVAEAAATGFRPDVLEKVALLLGLLETIQSHPFLKGKLALKGGTALNLFVFDVPRLSVDIDLNYIGAAGREAMLDERPKIEQAVQAVFSREGFSIRRMPEEHVGGKWSLRYESALGRGGNLEVDINFMLRVPLWPVRIAGSHPVGTWRADRIPVLDLHELAAGKLVALFARKQARDLFDSYRILGMYKLDYNLLRIGFVVYGAMNRKDWRTVTPEDVDFEADDLNRQLVPMLRAEEVKLQAESAEYGTQLVKNSRERISAVLAFSHAESEFLDLVLDRGIIDPTILTPDEDLRKRIEAQPLLEWKALNVRLHKGLS